MNKIKKRMIKNASIDSKIDGLIIQISDEMAEKIFDKYINSKSTNDFLESNTPEIDINKIKNDSDLKKYFIDEVGFDLLSQIDNLIRSFDDQKKFSDSLLFIVEDHMDKYKH